MPPGDAPYPPPLHHDRFASDTLDCHIHRGAIQRRRNRRRRLRHATDGVQIVVGSRASDGVYTPMAHSLLATVGWPFPSDRPGLDEGTLSGPVGAAPVPRLAENAIAALEKVP